jgi:hypothetical protein
VEPFYGKWVSMYFVERGGIVWLVRWLEQVARAGWHGQISYAPAATEKYQDH